MEGELARIGAEEITNISLPSAEEVEKKFQDWLGATRAILCYDDDFLIRIAFRRGQEEWSVEFFLSKEKAEQRMALLRERGYEVACDLQPMKKACENLAFLYGITVIPGSLKRTSNAEQAFQKIQEEWQKKPHEMLPEILVRATCELEVRDRFGRRSVGYGEAMKAVSLVYSGKGITLRRNIKNIADEFHAIAGIAETRARKRAILSLAIFDRQLRDEFIEEEVHQPVQTVHLEPVAAANEKAKTQEEKKPKEETKTAKEEEEKKQPSSEKGAEEEKEETAKEADAVSLLLPDGQINSREVETKRKSEISALVGAYPPSKIKEIKEKWLKEKNLPESTGIYKSLTDQGFELFKEFLMKEIGK